MEQFLRVRLELRKEKLEENITRAEELLLVHKNEKEVLEYDVMRVHATLKQALHGMQTDAEKYISTNSQNTDVLRSALERELKAEELLVELDLVISGRCKKVDAQENTTQATVRLPKLEMPKFDGDVLKWTGFWDRFVARIDSQKLKDSEKLLYLLSLLDKEAKAAVQGLSITDANYQVAVELLKKRFDNQQQVIFSHYEALDKLNCCEYTAEDCRKNLNMIEIRLKVLASLGENVESNFFRSLIKSKFPEKVIYELNLLLGNDQTIPAIRRTLDTIVGAMEWSKEMNTPVEGKRKATDNDKTVKRAKLNCVFCAEPHYNDKCTTTSIEERMKLLTNRCFICFKTGHNVRDCKKRTKCYYCNGKHNRALCPKKESDGNSAGGSQQ